MNNTQIFHAISRNQWEVINSSLYGLLEEKVSQLATNFACHSLGLAWQNKFALPEELSGCVKSSCLTQSKLMGFALIDLG